MRFSHSSILFALALALAIKFPGSLGAQSPAPEIPASQEAAVQAAKAGDYEKAMALIQKEAEKGSADANFSLGECYRTGTGVEASIPKALEYYELAASDGQALALLRLGEIYWQGAEGVEKDADRGKFHLQAAAEAGEARAWNYLGQLDESEAHAADALPDRERLFTRARSHFVKAAEAGNMEAQYYYYRLLANGQGGTKDLPKAIEWLRKSSLAGYAPAMSDLGTRYQEGNGIEVDHAAALGWFLAGAERGSLPAMTNLGLCYANGFGVPQNFDRAGSWYSKASKQGYPPAQFLLGQLFENGQGTEKNPVYAYVNYSRSASGGIEAAAPKRDALAAKLTPEQLAEARKILELSGKPGKKE